MIDFNNIKQFTTHRPDHHTLFGSPKDFDELPEIHKEQILFLNAEASKFMYKFCSLAKLLTGPAWDPFAKGNFKIVEQFSDFADTGESRSALKKWLFNRNIRFRSWIFVLPNYDQFAFITTWKMLIKYSGELFFSDDVIVFDVSINWCLFYFHEDRLFFGKDNIYDPAEDEKNMELISALKKKFPQHNFPY